MLCLLFPAAPHAEGRVLTGNVMLIGAHDEPTPAIGATVSLKGAGNPVRTLRGGEFRLFLPDIYKPGEDITLNVEIEGYRVFHPVGGETKVPADLDKQSIDIHLLSVGSRKFLSEAQIEYVIKTAAEESKVQVIPIGEKPAPIDFTGFIQKWASRYGFTEAQVTEEIRKWVAQTQQGQADFYKLGLAAFAEKNFRRARELFTQSGENNEKKLEEAREATVRDFRLAGDAAYNDYRFAEALASYQRAFKHTSKEQTPVLWAVVLIDIGTAQGAMGLRTHGADIHQRLAEAVAAYRAALEVYARESLPRDWAITQNNLGAALREQGIRTAGEASAKLLSEAVAAYRAALEVYTRESVPQQWAATQNNLASALGYQGIRTAGETGAKLLSEAVAACRAALEIRTHESLPQQWAMTKSNLGNALANQGIRTAGEAGAKLLSEAVAAYRAALEVQTHESLPQGWATTQNSLGTALAYQGIRTAGEAGAKLLSEAVAAYRAALEVYTRESLPQPWAMTQHNLARAYTALEDWPKAAASYAELLHANLDDGEAYRMAGWRNVSTTLRHQLRGV